MAEILKIDKKYIDEGVQKAVKEIKRNYVPLSVIEDIKAEIDQKQYDFIADKDYDEGIRFGLMLAYQILNKHISGKESE